MNEEPQTTEIPGDANQPATKGDLAALRHELQQALASKDDLAAVKQELREEMTQVKQELRQEMTDFKDEIIRHFDVVAENIHHDVAGANQDRVKLIEDKQSEHGRRITTVEERMGLR